MRSMFFALFRVARPGPAGRWIKQERRRSISRPAAPSYGEGVKKINFGNVDFSRVVEWAGAFATTDVLFPSLPGELWREHASWLTPDFLDARTNAWLANAQTWILRSAGRTILIDTGLGNDKERKVELFHQRQGDFLDRLAAAGVEPEDVTSW